jgi:hypothetical protein
VQVFLPRKGSLDRVARIASERIAYGNEMEPGVRGRVEYRMSSAVQYMDGGIRVLEQVLARDDAERVLRMAELERSYTFAPDGSMVVSDDSLWSRVYPSKDKAKDTKEKKEP